MVVECRSDVIHADVLHVLQEFLAVFALGLRLLHNNLHDSFLLVFLQDVFSRDLEPVHEGLREDLLPFPLLQRIDHQIYEFRLVDDEATYGDCYLLSCASRWLILGERCLKNWLFWLALARRKSSLDSRKSAVLWAGCSSLAKYRSISFATLSSLSVELQSYATVLIFLRSRSSPAMASSSRLKSIPIG